MDKIVKFPDRARVREQAAQWLVQLDKGELEQQQSTDFHLWLEQDPAHGRALVELARLWDQMGILAELSELFPLTRSQHAAAGGLLRIPGRRVLAAAAAVLLLQIDNIFPGSGAGPQQTLSRVYHTRVGEQINISLPDASRITLNTDSELQVAYTASQRNIRLRKGEAHFQVAHDASRPFMVFAGNGIVRAVGTAFNVHLRDGNVEVMVTEGRVGIASGIEDNEPLNEIATIPLKKFHTTLSAGQAVEYGSNNIRLVQDVKPEIIQRKLSWEHGMLKFEGEPLDQVVREINRYTDTEIVITDPGIRKIRVGGYFKTGETESLLNVLKDNFDIAASRVNERLVYLSRADDHKP